MDPLVSVLLGAVGGLVGTAPGGILGNRADAIFCKCCQTLGEVIKGKPAEVPKFRQAYIDSFREAVDEIQEVLAERHQASPADYGNLFQSVKPRLKRLKEEVAQTNDAPFPAEVLSLLLEPTGDWAKEQIAVVKGALENLALVEGDEAIYENLIREEFFTRVCRCFAKRLQNDPALINLFTTSMVAQIESEFPELHKTLGKIQAQLAQVLAQLPRQAAPPKQHCHNIPPSGVVEFVGRDEQLAEIHKQLAQPKPLAIVAVKGMGGIGKTELAIQYAIKHTTAPQLDYPGGVCWLLARGRDVGEQVVDFARSLLAINPPENLSLEGRVKHCWGNWPEGKTLIILDDVTDYKSIKPYLPPVNTPFRVLITTREKLGTSVVGITLDVLTEAAALALLRSLVGDRVEQELETAQEICTWLGYLPLGLELVGRYLGRKTNLSLARMLQRLKNRDYDLTKLPQDEDMTAERGVAAAFDLSWDELSDEAKELGCLLSQFALAPIPWSLVQASSTTSESGLEDLRDDILVNLHLLQPKAAETYQLHQLIREFLQQKQEAASYKDQQRQAICQTMVDIAKSIPQTPTLDDVQRVNSAIPHLVEVAEVLRNHLSDEYLAWPFVGLGRFYEGQGLYSLAEPWYAKCLAVTQSHLGEEHPAVAASINNLA
uniref:tetratricopeptide repeat protein n=1 Tax=Candidatus Cyanaurora vandensis TaxID=2714958 RepID=UPI002580C47D